MLGSGTHQLVRQFTFESIIVVAFATLIALGLIELARLPFALLTGRDLSFALLLQPIGIFTLILFVIALGLFAGSYPSFFMARLKPSLVLKGDIRSGFRSSRLRNSLVTLQFVISIVLITCTLIVQQQLKFMRSKKLGFDKENIVVIGNADRLDSHKAFMNKLTQMQSVKLAGSSEYKPFVGYDGTVAVTDADKETRKLISTAHVDHDYLDVLKHEFVAGRNFSRDFSSDSAGVILNEVAADYLYEDDPIGQKLYLADDNVSRSLTVIGVMQNFNYQSLKNEVTPLVYILRENEPNI
ncbi:MAG: ABC transporter permease, partial [Cyclobacteriaceae bacterium]